MFSHHLLAQHSRSDSLPEHYFGYLRFYLRENPSKWMGSIPIPALSPDSTYQQGIESLNQLCDLLNQQLPHLYHYYQVNNS
jgi:hypothetical protein